MNSVIITLRTNEELKQKLDMIALEEQRSLNNLINRILTMYIDQKEKEKDKELISC